MWNVEQLDKVLVNAAGINASQLLVYILAGLLALVTARLGIALWKVMAFMRATLTLWRAGVMLTAMGLASTASWGAMRFHQFQMYEAKVTNYLTKAWAERKPAKAVERIDSALAYLDEKGVTEGDTAVMYGSHEDDIGEWREQLTAEREKFARKAIPASLVADASDKPKWTGDADSSEPPPFVKSGGPVGISVAPYNKAYFAWGAGSVFAVVMGGLCLLLRRYG